MSIRIGDKIIASTAVDITDATIEQSGIIKLATDSDIILGTNETKAVTPKQLKDKTTTDDTTVSYVNNQLKVFGITTKNDQTAYLWIGTEEDYDTEWESGLIDPDWICIITDD